MDQLWGVLGRACVDGGFAAELMRTVVERDEMGTPVPEDEVSKLTALYDLLAKYYFRASRWERGELNRVLWWLKKTKGAEALKNLAVIWQGLPGIGALPAYPAELWKLVGLCSVDKEVAGRYFAEPDKIEDLVKEAPKFVLVRSEIDVLKGFFKVNAAKQWLGVVHRESWIPPTGVEQAAFYRALAERLLKLADYVEGMEQPMVHCAPGFDAKLMSYRSYRHPPSPALEALASDLKLTEIYFSTLAETHRSRVKSGRTRRQIVRTG